MRIIGKMIVTVLPINWHPRSVLYFTRPHRLVLTCHMSVTISLHSCPIAILLYVHTFINKSVPPSLPPSALSNVSRQTWIQNYITFSTQLDFYFIFHLLSPSTHSFRSQRLIYPAYKSRYRKSSIMYLRRSCGCSRHSLDSLKKTNWYKLRCNALEIGGNRTRDLWMLTCFNLLIWT